MTQELLQWAVTASGMVNLLNHGGASCVYSEGCHGVTQEHLERFTRLVLATARDCRTCMHWTPHHRADVWHCSSASRCVDASHCSPSGAVREWKCAAMPTPTGDEA
jgi:hypothetical protein